jgi:hypothetical protein
MEIKEIIPNLNKKVKYKESTSYTLNGSTIRKDKTGKIYYTAELLDKNKHSVLIVKLEDIESYE